MSLIGKTGSVCEMRGEVCVEWKIPDYFSLSGEIDSYYQSPVFCLPDSCWSLRIFPHGRKDTPDWLGLCVTREDSGPPKHVRLSLGIKMADGVRGKTSPATIVKRGTMGHLKLILLSDLLDQRFQVAPSGVLTFTCSLTSDVPHSSEVSLCSRLWNLSRDLKSMLDEDKGDEEEGTKNTFLRLKPMEGRELRAHRTILEARCDYFAGMLGNAFQESSNGLVDIDDIEEGVLQCILAYLYTGEAEGMSDRNVCKVYVAAHKMLLVGLQRLCVHYMRENLGRELICDVIALVEIYEEEELRESALDYFTRHAEEVFDCDGWKNLSTENCPLVAKFLQRIVVRRKT